jgi:hypothetical protein
MCITVELNISKCKTVVQDFFINYCPHYLVLFVFICLFVVFFVLLLLIMLYGTDKIH